MNIARYLGKTFSRLTVLAVSPRTDRHLRLICHCSCGNFAVVRASSLTAKRYPTRGCGCGVAENGIKHGQRHSSEYRSWTGAKHRCFNPKNKAYARYGGRGITVCDRWRNSFSAFLADMGPKPSPRLTIDRIDNDGDYEPGNCRWATYSEQNSNRSPFKKPKRSA